MKTLNLFITLFSILFITSCATTTQFVSLPQGELAEDTEVARIYVLRPSIFGSAIKMKLYEDETMVGKLGPKSYLLWEVQEGVLTITSQAKNKDAMAFSPKAGETYYIKQKVRMGWLYARTKIELMDEVEAKEVLLKLSKPGLELAVGESKE